MNPLVSIIIPAYNVEAYIERCLDSILAQTYTNLEIIVVDDGSKDRTGEILDRLAKKDARIRVIHKENGGVSAARNTGIDAATGDYIGFVDSDDTITEDMYELLVKNAIVYGADISHCGYQMVFPDRKDDYYGTGVIKEQDGEQGVIDLLEGTMIEPGLVNKLYRREVVGNLRLDTKIKINEDLLFNYYLFKSAQKSVFEDQMKYFYMVRNNSATSTKNEHHVLDPILVLEEMMRQESGKTLDILSRRYISVLSNFVVIPTTELSGELQELQQKKRLILQKFVEENKGLLSSKQYSQVKLAIKSPRMYRKIHYVYGTITGSRNKYTVKI